MSQSASTFSSITFAPSTLVNASGLNIDAGSSPNVVEFLRTAYLFFRGSGNNGIWFASVAAGQWSYVKQITAKNSIFLGSFGGSSPSAVVLDPVGAPSSLYLFFAGNAGDGVFYSSTRDGGDWDNVTQIVPTNENWLGIMNATSPSAITLDDEIILFYTGIGSNGIFSVVSSDSVSKWGRDFGITAQGTANQEIMNILAGTSPSAVVYQGLIYLFFTVGGTANGAIPTTAKTSSGTSSDNRIWYTTSSDGEEWSAPQSLATLLNTSMNVLQGTSPAAFCFASALYLFWKSSSGLQGTASFDGKTWVPVSSLTPQQGQEPVGARSASIAVVGGNPTLFWTGPSTKVYSAAFAPLFSLVNTPLSQIFSRAEAGLPFQIIVDDTASAEKLKALVPVSSTPQMITAEMLESNVRVLQIDDGPIPTGDSSFELTPDEREKLLFYNFLLLVGTLAVCTIGTVLLLRWDPLPNNGRQNP